MVISQLFPMALMGHHTSAMPVGTCFCVFVFIKSSCSSRMNIEKNSLSISSFYRHQTWGSKIDKESFFRFSHEDMIKQIKKSVIDKILI